MHRSNSAVVAPDPSTTTNQSWSRARDDRKASVSTAASFGDARFTETNVLTSTVKSAVVEYMRYHGYSSTLKTFLSEVSEHPPSMDTVDLGTAGGQLWSLCVLHFRVGSA